jgi:hypothetical protein
MEIIKNEEKKLVEVWLSRAEASSSFIRNQLKNSCFSNYKSEGYRVVVYESGQRDLFSATRDLLLENRTRPVSKKTQHSI